MLPVILGIILIAILFGMGVAIHALWIVALVLIGLFVIGYAMRRGGLRRRMHF